MGNLEQELKMAKKILHEVQKTVIGKDEMLCKILMAILAKGHVLLDDIPGVGKTTMAMAFAQTLGLDCKRIQFTPDVMPSDVIGYNMYNRITNAFDYKPGAAMCNILLADEINRTSPKTQSALLQAMEEGSVTVDGVTRKLPSPFFVIATQNPFGSAGTQKLPDSQMDRFMIRLKLGYPSVEDEIQIMKTRKESTHMIQSEKVVDADQLKTMQEIVNQIFVDDSIYEYVALIAKASRSWPGILQGMSPRTCIAVLAMVRAEAFLRGHSYVLVSDIQNVIMDTVCHRIIVDNTINRDDKSVRTLFNEVIKSVKVPKII